MAEETSPEWLWGASAIARAIGRTDKQTFHMLSQGVLPAKKVGERWVAERGQLMSFFLNTATGDLPGSTTPAAVKN